MGVIPWSPLNGGWLTGKYRRDTEIPEGSRLACLVSTNPQYQTESPTNQRKLDLVEELAKLPASDAGVSLIDLAVVFVLQHPAVTAAIIGPRTMLQLEDQLGAADVTLDDQLLDRIDELGAARHRRRRARRLLPGARDRARRAPEAAMTTSAPRTIISGLAFGEGPRWHDGALWFSDMHGHEVIRSTVDGDTTTVAEVTDDEPSGLGWLPDGRLLVVAMETGKLLRQEADGTLVEHADLSGLAAARSTT